MVGDSRLRKSVSAGFGQVRYYWRMKDVYEVLRQKEREVSRLKKEVEALRIAAPLVSEDDQAGDDQPTLKRGK